MNTLLVNGSLSKTTTSLKYTGSLELPIDISLAQSPEINELTIIDLDASNGEVLSYLTDNFSETIDIQGTAVPIEISYDLTTEKENALFILKDFNKFLSDISVSRKLRNLLSLLKTQPKNLIILATEISIPKELVDIITVLEFKLPTSQEIKNELVRLFDSLNIKYDNSFLYAMVSIDK